MTEENQTEWGELEEFERARSDLMALDFEELNTADYWNLLQIGQKILTEDSDINLYDLYKYPDARRKTFELIAETALCLNKLFATEWRITEYVELLEEHFKKMVRQRIASCDRLAALVIVKKIEKNQGKTIPYPKRQQIIRDLAVGGIV